LFKTILKLTDSYWICLVTF